MCIRDSICYRDWGSSTLIVHDGLLRTKVFAGDLFVQIYALLRAAITRVATHSRVDIFLVGIAKHAHSGDFERPFRVMASGCSG